MEQYLKISKRISLQILGYSRIAAIRNMSLNKPETRLSLVHMIRFSHEHDFKKNIFIYLNLFKLFKFSDLK